MASLAVAAWAALWTLLATSHPDLPRVSERERVDRGASRADTEARVSEGNQALRQLLQARVEESLAERLGPGLRFETVRVESIDLAPGHADIKVWGLLLSDRATPAMLEVELRVDRERLEVQQLRAQAYSPHGQNPVLTAWLSGGSALSQVSP